MNTIDFDVAILGGGLAGCIAARNLAVRRPDLRVVMFERNRETSFKVGEATVELFTNHMLRRLGLSTYLYEKQLPKNGLRFFFDSPQKDTALPEMSEMGSKGLPFHPSFQLDRAAFERDLRDGLIGATELHEDAKVTGVELGDSAHAVTVEQGGATRTVRARWIVDASGRASIVQKQLGLREKSAHACAASWARATGVVDIDGLTMDPEFRARARWSSRRLSTVHFCNRGYWIWLIPLKGGVTSVGIVGHPRHVGREILRLEGLRAFCDRHRAVRELLAPAQWIDFGAYGQLAYGTRQFYSAQRWACVGEAAAFTDPFYSPGSDFIALGSDFVTDLIGRDRDGEDIGERVRVYDEYMRHRWDANIALYQDQYELLGSFELLRMRWEFDILSYYHLWVAHYMQDHHLDLAHLRTELRHRAFVVRALQRFGALFAQCERHLTANGDYERCNRGRFLEALQVVDFVREVGMACTPADEERRTLRIFEHAREQAFALLQRPAGAASTRQFADYVTGRALA